MNIFLSYKPTKCAENQNSVINKRALVTILHSASHCTPSLCSIIHFNYQTSRRQAFNQAEQKNLTTFCYPHPPPHVTIPVPPLTAACYLTWSSRHQNVFPNIPRSSWSMWCYSQRRRNLTSESLPGQQSPAISKSNAVHNRQSNIHSANSESRVRAVPTQENSGLFTYSFTSSFHLHHSLSLTPHAVFLTPSCLLLLLFPLPLLMLHLFSYSSLLVSSTSLVSSSFSLLFLFIFVVRFCFLFFYPCPSFCCTFYSSFPVLIYTPVSNSPHTFSTSPISCELPFNSSTSDISSRSSDHFFMFIYYFASPRCVKFNNKKWNIVANGTVYCCWYYCWPKYQ